MKLYPLFWTSTLPRGGDAAARFNFGIKITLFRIELRVSLLFPYQTEVNLLESFQANWLGLFEVRMSVTAACLANMEKPSK